MNKSTKEASIRGLLFSILFAFIGNALFAQQPLDTNLIGYWTFDDATAKDVSGNNHHGIIHGSPTSVITKNGSLGFYFDGIDDFIEIPFHEDLNVEDFTLTFWFSRDKNSEPGVKSLINKSWSQRNEGTSADVITMIPSERDFIAYLNWNGEPDYPPGEYFNDENFTMVNDSLFFVAFVKDGRNIRLIINDKTVLSRTLPMNTDLYKNAPLGIWTFAAQYDNGILKTFFQGILDNVRLYKVGLSKDKTDEIYIGNNVPLGIVASGENLCLQDTIMLQASGKFKKYLWNTGDTTEYIVVTEVGEYTLTAWNHPSFPVSTTYSIVRQPSYRKLFSLSENKLFLQADKFPESKCVEIYIKNIDSSISTLTEDNIWLSENSNFSLPLSQFPIMLNGSDSAKLTVCFYRNDFYLLDDILHMKTECNFDSIQLISPNIPVQLSGDSRCDVKVIANGAEQIFRLSVYPNPIHNEINVAISDDEDKQQFITNNIELHFGLYDVFGRKIYSIHKDVHGLQSFVIDAHNLPSGTYILVLENAHTPTHFVIYKL